MGISRADLETASDARREQAARWRRARRWHCEIVDQVYQATEPYQPIEGQTGFLGVLMSDPSVIVEAADPDSPAGVIVIGRVKGFCAYRHLQDGDVILQVNGQRVCADNDLTEVIKKCKGGDVVLLEILRGGQQMDVSVTLTARPIWCNRYRPWKTSSATGSERATTTGKRRFRRCSMPASRKSTPCSLTRDSETPSCADRTPSALRIG